MTSYDQNVYLIICLLSCKVKVLLKMFFIPDRPAQQLLLNLYLINKTHNPVVHQNILDVYLQTSPWKYSSFKSLLGKYLKHSKNKITCITKKIMNSNTSEDLPSKTDCMFHKHFSFAKLPFHNTGLENTIETLWEKTNWPF